jgi:hypothetical protein
MSNSSEHWDKVYKTKNHTKLSWHQDISTISFEWILHYANKRDAIIDVGSGVSILIDNLIDSGYLDMSLVEISKTAIETTKKRIGNSTYISFFNKDILEFHSNKKYKIWHDRAVFHFLNEKKEQQLYIDKVNQYLALKGYFILATFSPEGPNECSGLSIEQYDEKKISKLLMKNFKLIKTIKESHPHPNGGNQNFNYFCFQKTK